LEPVLRKFDRAAELQRQASREVEQVSRASKPFQPLPAGPIVDASYANKIKTKIRSNVVLPAGITGNPEAIFEVVQLPSGDVISARLRQSSGNRAYDDAVERAILKSSPLPRPDRPDQFARELQLKFRPVE
jgi:colicin import membrane protein